MKDAALNLFGMVLLAAVVVFLGIRAIDKWLEKPKPIPPPPIITHVIDSTRYQLERLRADSLSGILSFEKFKYDSTDKYSRAERESIIVYYQRLLFAQTDSGTVIPVARLDTVLQNTEKTRTYHDTVRIKYVYYPVNQFRDLYLGFQPRTVVFEYNDTARIVEVPYTPFFRGFYVGAGVWSNWRGNLLDMALKEYSFSFGATFQPRSMQIDLVPIDVILRNKEAWTGFNVRARYYPWN